MKRIFLIFIYLMFVAIPINIQANTLHYIPTPEQLQPAPVNIAPNVSHNVNFVSPANSFVDFGTGTAPSQAPASPPSNAKNAVGSANLAAPAQESAATGHWTTGLLLFAALLAAALIILKMRDGKK